MDWTILVVPESLIPVLVLAFVLSLALTVLMAAATHARTGLRGRRVYLFSGFALGLLAGGVELVIDAQLAPIEHVVGELGLSLWTEFGIAAAIAAAAYFVSVGLAMQLGLLLHRQSARRRGDVVALAAGLGSGLALTATLLRLEGAGIWPPSSLLIAVVYPPVQLGFVLLLAAAVLTTREGLGGRTLLWQTAALLLQWGYQFVLRVNDSVGHWLAWLEPGRIGALWFGVIVLAWALGVGVVTGLARAEQAVDYRGKDGDSGLLSARLWLWLAALVLLPTGLLLVASLFVELDLRTAWTLVMALLTTPMLVAALVLRTALTLRRRPEARGSAGAAAR
jgi:hypothetical protein